MRSFNWIFKIFPRLQTSSGLLCQPNLYSTVLIPVFFYESSPKAVPLPSKTRKVVFTVGHGRLSLEIFQLLVDRFLCHMEIMFHFISMTCAEFLDFSTISMFPNRSHRRLPQNLVRHRRLRLQVRICATRLCFESDRTVKAKFLFSSAFLFLMTIWFTLTLQQSA